MAHVFADDVGDLNPERVGFGHHTISCLLLFVFLAAVGDCTSVLEIVGPWQDVVPAHQLLSCCIDEVRCFFCPALVHDGVYKSSAGIRCVPTARVVYCKMPAASSTHRKSTDRQALVVESGNFSKMGQRLIHIGFTSKFERVAVSSKWMQDDCVLRGVLTGPCHTLVKERNFSFSVTTSMQPNICAVRRFWSCVVNGDDNPVWLD